MRTKKSFFLIFSTSSFLILLSFIFFIRKKPISVITPAQDPSLEVVNKLTAVAALGKLEPAGSVLRLAAPVSGFGGTPRVSQLFVREGESINEGQILATFDNRPRLLADIAVAKALIKTLETNIRMQKREISRYELAASQGAAPLIVLEEKKDQLVKIEGELEQALAELMGLNADLSDSQLKSPINGVVLRIRSRVGERPTATGVVDVGANQLMQAVIEVYESDIDRISLEQAVTLISENGGFKGKLIGKVIRISPEVRQRQVLSTDPTGDADARIVEVRVELDTTSTKKISHLTGMKVIARFDQK